MRFSVVTVCLNPGRYLEETIKSVLGQDAAELDYCLIDGGSTDGTLDTLRHFAAADPRIRWSSAPDAGIADAMNRGVSCCQGEIVAFLHADDRYPDRTVLGDVRDGFAKAPHALWLTGAIREIDARGKVVCERPARAFSYRRLLRNNIIYHPATFVRREAFDRVGRFDTDLRYAMDYDLWLRLGKISPPITAGRVLAEFRIHAGSLSTAHRQAAIDEEYQVRLRYVRSTIGRLAHALYHSWRRQRC